MIFKTNDHACDVCGNKFPLLASNLYYVPSVQLLGKAWRECFDCLVCGCQNIVGIREGELPVGGFTAWEGAADE